MLTVLADKLAPVTFRIGFLNCSFVNDRDAFIQWKSQHFKSIEFKETEDSQSSTISGVVRAAVSNRNSIPLTLTGTFIISCLGLAYGLIPRPILASHFRQPSVELLDPHFIKRLGAQKPQAVAAAVL